METPKIIHFLWLNFNNNSDGIIDTTLSFFIDRIKELHPDYEINFINNWDKCMESINDEYSWIKHIIINKNIGGAHRSDVLRFYYLYTMGGVWVDISTFLVTFF